ncbi:hypothetical protein COO60DRAFT_1625148 [Scenedesmus sp. NREL 46B-D3]|nr:hypothetical protein COO60DRAFT_1625148 [Scenedesmus sp. NREL 46B-D3]
MLVLAAAAAAALLVPSPSPMVDAASASVPSSRAGDNVGFLTDSQVDKKRKKANFRRSHDGHVAMLNRFSKQWTDVKCDLQVPGLLLLREASGQVFYLGYAGLNQVDLSDDQVVAAVAADDWENSMTLVKAETAAGGVEALEMTREEFYALVSLHVTFTPETI